jgi:hypothetical protein
VSILGLAPSPCFINDGDYVGGFTPEQMQGLLEAVEADYVGWFNPDSSPSTKSYGYCSPVRKRKSEPSSTPWTEIL